MELNKVINTLKSIYNAMCSLSVTGYDNCVKIVGICNELNRLITEASSFEGEKDV